MSNNFRFAEKTLVFDSEGNKIGEMPIVQAQQIAQEQQLDLVEITRQGDTSVCRIVDEGKWKYDQKKKLKKNAIRHYSMKEVKIGIRIDDHDRDIKIQRMFKFLRKGHDVRIVVEMHGREKSNPEVARLKLMDILSSFKQYRNDLPKKTGSSISTIIHSQKKKDYSENVTSQKSYNRQIGEKRLSRKVHLDG